MSLPWHDQEFSELRDWFAEWKRDNPLGFWLAVLLPWVYAVINIGVPATLVSAFPFSDARQVLAHAGSRFHCPTNYMQVAKRILHFWV
jgi:hypothetical protein